MSTRFMRRALEVAAAPPRRVSPNPAVGCVVVRDGEIIAEGVTQPPGGPHAEVMALRMAGRRAQGADLYVTLEPCNHTGRTPPCTEAIIAAGVRKVVIGAVDPNTLVDGGGVARLRAAGIEVEVDEADGACARHIAPFRQYLEGRPWVTLKAAITLDGRVATASGDSKWITGEASRRDAHRLRARADAVLVGAETARLDDPRLNVRMVEGEDPLRVVLDTHLTLTPEAQILGDRAIVLHGPGVDAERAAALAATGAQLRQIPLAGARLDLKTALELLASEFGVIHLLVEGGGRLHGALMQAGLADELVFYIAPKLIGEGRPVMAMPSTETIAAGWRLAHPEITPMGEDVRVRGLLERDR